MSSHEGSPLTPRASDSRTDSDVEWTPGLGTNHDSENSDSDSNEPTKATPPWLVTVFNVSMTNLKEVAGRNMERLDYQLESWDDSSELVKELTYNITARLILRKERLLCETPTQQRNR